MGGSPPQPAVTSLQQAYVLDRPCPACECACKCFFMINPDMASLFAPSAIRDVIYPFGVFQENKKILSMSGEILDIPTQNRTAREVVIDTICIMRAPVTLVAGTTFLQAFKTLEDGFYALDRAEGSHNVHHLASRIVLPWQTGPIWSQLSVKAFGDLPVQEVYDTAAERGMVRGIIAMARILQVHRSLALYSMTIDNAVIGAIKSIKQRSQAVELMRSWHEDKDIKISAKFLDIRR